MVHHKMFAKQGFVTQTLKVPKKRAIGANMTKCEGRISSITDDIQILIIHPETVEIVVEDQAEAEVEVISTTTLIIGNHKVNLFPHLPRQLLIQIMVAI